MPRLDVRRLQRSYPDGQLPWAIKKLCEYQENYQHYEYAGEFILDEGAVDFLDDLPHKDAFAGFGTDATGSVFAHWSGSIESLTAQSIERCPIVYLDSEAVFSSVIASDFGDFIELLLLATDDLGNLAAEDEELRAEESTDQVTHFRQWVLDTFGISVPTEPRNIVRKAKSVHQHAFIDWYRLWQGENPWTPMV
ncbi:MAG: hypothetical protein H8E66_22110 [Planctomycetes bacterium]|nr:hypothetical protein [Planctomycetota bacterium]